jgi:hypothetical protein
MNVRCNILTENFRFRSLPDSWKEYTHLNGSSYYYNKALRLTTKDDVYDQQTLKAVLDLYEISLDIRTKGGAWPEDLETNIFAVRRDCCPLLSRISHSEGKVYYGGNGEVLYIRYAI